MYCISNILSKSSSGCICVISVFCKSRNKVCRLDETFGINDIGLERTSVQQGSIKVQIFLTLYIIKSEQTGFCLFPVCFEIMVVLN